MDAERLRVLIAGGETLDVEFKGEEKEALSDKELVETVVCLANRSKGETGWLLVGVEDDGRVTGARPRHDTGTTDVQRVQALIANRTRPSVCTAAEIVELEGRQVLVIEVPVLRTPVGTSDGRYLRRTVGGKGEPICVPSFYQEMLALQSSRGLLDYSSLELRDAKWEDLDPLEFERYRRSIRENKGRGDNALLELPDRELAKAVGAVTESQNALIVPTLGLLLFGREDALTRMLPSHEVAFQVLSGTKVEVNDFFRWPLLRMVDELMSRFRARYQEQEILVGMNRVAIPNYSESAFREGVANALIHRDYTRLGAVHVQWHDDHVAVSSPGGFPEGVTLQNLLVTAPRPRNPMLADAFKRAGVVERTGRGIDTIFYEQLRTGRPAPSYERSDQTMVVLVLPGGESFAGFVRLVAEQGLAGKPPSLDELLLLRRLLDARRLELSEAQRLVQKPESDTARVLAEMVKSGLAVPIEGGRAYEPSMEVLAKVVVRRPRVGRFGLTADEMEQQVMNWVRMNNSINRTKVMELCGIEAREATYLLRKLLDSGMLRKIGARRWTRYVLPGSRL
jgi:ATP-dependent DNA helicase RecG